MLWSLVFVPKWKLSGAHFHWSWSFAVLNIELWHLILYPASIHAKCLILGWRLCPGSRHGKFSIAVLEMWRWWHLRSFLDQFPGIYPHKFVLVCLVTWNNIYSLCSSCYIAVVSVTPHTLKKKKKSMSAYESNNHHVSFICCTEERL